MPTLQLNRFILSSPRLLSDYFSLTKPRLAMLNIIAAFSGILMSRSLGDLLRHAESVLYISILIAGAAALKCVWEAEGDRLMSRTRDRAIASGRISVASGLIFGLSLSTFGLLGLYDQGEFTNFHLRCDISC